MEITIVDIVIFVFIFLIGLYYYGIRSYDYFKNTGVKSIKPSIPFLGSMSSVMVGRESFYDFFKRLYNEYPDEKYVGVFEGRKPLIMINDLELIKNVSIKSFDSFHDRRGFVSGDPDDLLSYALSLMKGEKWRDMRAALSPAFTSSKMRNLYIYMEECAKDMALFFMKQKDKEVIDIDVKDVVSRYTNDVIANAVFGFKINSLENRDNDIYRFGLQANSTSLKQALKIYSLLFFPPISKLLKLSFLPKATSDFFVKLVNETMETREKQGIVRPDMINLLMEAKKGTLVHETDSEVTGDTGFATVEESDIGKRQIQKKWTETELTAQAFIFYLAGFETTSTMLAFFVYEMVRNPDIQEKLQQEIDEILEKSEGKFTYQDVLGLKYLDMCLSETLRFWPPLGVLDRVCATPFTLPPPNSRTTKTYEVKKDDLIWIPVSGMMKDPKYFPNPEKFDPERFSNENKSAIDPMTYLPFGIGPRNCIGSRFALLEMKIFICHLLSKFSIVPVESTIIPLKIQKGLLQGRPEKPIRVGLKLR